LIVTISFWAAQKEMGSPAYGAAKAADDKLIRDMAHQLRDHHVAAVSLYPGLVRTENVMRFAEYFDLSNSESPQFVGRWRHWPAIQASWRRRGKSWWPRLWPGSTASPILMGRYRGPSRSPRPE